MDHQKGKKIIPFFERIAGTFLLILCVGILISGIRVHAEEDMPDSESGGKKYIYREASGDAEELVGYRLSEEEEAQIPEQQEAQSIQWGGSSREEAFLSCGSDYGYRDMLLRSNGANRQSAYRKIDQAARSFTLSDSNGEAIDMDDGVFYIAATIDIGNGQLSEEEIQEVYFTYRNDNPQYFWLSNWVMWGSRSIYILTYNAYGDGQARGEAFQEILNTADTVYHSKVSDGDSRYEIVRKIHDSLIADIEYSANVDEETAHSIAGAMTAARSAVCEGYAKVMQLMMNAYEIPNIYVTGLGGGGGHAWNMVQMTNGKYYWLDATWDDQPYEVFQHSYFLVGNAAFTDHIPDSPNASGSDFLYELPAAADENYDPNNPGDVVEPDPGEVIKGDVTGEGDINIEDLRMVLRAVCGKVTLDDREKAAADVTYDDKINIDDLRLILRYVCGKVSEL